MLKVSEDKTFLDTCLREACESIQRCLALLSDQTEEVNTLNLETLMTTYCVLCLENREKNTQIFLASFMKSQ